MVGPTLERMSKKLVNSSVALTRVAQINNYYINMSKFDRVLPGLALAASLIGGVGFGAAAIVEAAQNSPNGIQLQLSPASLIDVRANKSAVFVSKIDANAGFGCTERGVMIRGGIFDGGVTIDSTTPFDARPCPNGMGN